MNNSILKVENISKSFDGKKIIEDINVCLAEGETVSLLGVSGSGKTTLFNIISGIMPPDAGDVYLNGECITSEPGHISYMLQKDLLFEHKKIIDNVSLPLVLRGISKKEARAEAKKHMEFFGLSGTQNKYPEALSGGMRQRAALLRTYLCGGKVALLDEPFSAVDTITKSELHRWYLNISKSLGISTLLITHDIDEAILLSDRICILSGNPARITDEICVNEPGDGRIGFELTEEFINCKKRIVNALSFK